MIDTKRAAALSGLEAEEDFAGTADLMMLADEIRRTDFATGEKNAVNTESLRKDEVKTSCDKNDIMKNSKNGFSIPRIV